MTNPLGEYEPNWDRIVNSPVWIDEIVPWLSDLERETINEFGGVPDMEMLRQTQGKLAMVRDILQMPAAIISMRKLEKERESEDAGRRGIGSYFRTRRG